MTMKLIHTLPLLIGVVAASCSSCSSSRRQAGTEAELAQSIVTSIPPVLFGLTPSADTVAPADTTASAALIPVSPMPGSTPSMLPKAILYKTSGDYLDNVPVQVAADGTLISFPAPTDIPAGAKPVVLAKGWILSPLGVSSRTVFTKWTLDEYRALKECPTPDEILTAVIPGAKVVMTIQAPMTLSEALADTAAVNRFLTPQPRR